MLIYSKVIDGEKVLFYSESGLPDPNNDVELTYENEDGEAVDVYEKTYFYNKDGGMYAGTSLNQLPQDEDEFVYVLADEV